MLEDNKKEDEDSIIRGSSTDYVFADQENKYDPQEYLKNRQKYCGDNKELGVPSPTKHDLPHRKYIEEMKAPASLSVGSYELFKQNQDLPEKLRKKIQAEFEKQVKLNSGTENFLEFL